MPTKLAKALERIALSSLADFASAVEWGQWCRAVASDAITGGDWESRTGIRSATDGPTADATPATPTVGAVAESNPSEHS